MEKPFATSLIFSALSVFALGCGTEAADRIDNRLDCRQICARYEDCADADYDTEDCRENCRDTANDNAAFEKKVEKCSDCLDGDNSCTEDAFKCSDDCVGIVP